MIAIPSDWQAKGVGNAPFTIDMAQFRAERKRQQRRAAISHAPITHVLAIPRRVTLAGGDYVVGELRLIDYAELQAWIEDRAAHPLADEPADTPDGRRDQVAGVWETIRSWPPRLGSEESMPYLSTRAYRRMFLAVMLRRHHSDVALDPVRLAKIEASCTRGEWAALRRVGWGMNPLAEVVAEFAPETDASPGTDWAATLYRIAESQNYTQAELGELTLSFFRLMVAGGKAPEQSSSFGRLVNRARIALGIASKER